MEYPKVLVISHNPFSDIQNNGKTLSAFFSGWPKDKIAQIYLTPDKPDYTICEKFFRITDLEILKNFVKKEKYGNIIKKGSKLENEKEILHKSKGYIFIRNLFVKRLPLMSCIRNWFWQKVRPWENNDLESWIKEFKPDIVFFQSSSMYSVFDMVDYICNKFNTTLFMETTDDYVTKHFSIDPFYLIDITKTTEKYKKLVKKAKCVFAIGDMMAEEYTNRFGGKFKVAMNSIDISKDVIPYDQIQNKEITLTYAGNLGLNRWKTLYSIGKTLKKLRKEGIKAKLNIYSINKPNKKILKKLNLDNVMTFKGSLNHKQLIEVRNNSDVLVHVESFDRKNKYITRLSISTKIPEYLVSERCILAIGPEDVASIKYIQDNDIGEVICDKKKTELKIGLIDIIQNRINREQYIKKGLKIAEKNHSFDKNKVKIQNILCNYKEF